MSNSFLFPNNFKRSIEIFKILFKYGFEDLITHTELYHSIVEHETFYYHEKLKDLNKYTRWERVRMAIEELGPTFMKLGQMLSNRSDLLNKELIFELEKLQDSSFEVPFEYIQSKVKEELNGSIETYFAYFDETPLASASIGQVHKAILISGENVVVKVQRPGIKKIITNDLAILKELATLLSSYFIKNYNFDIFSYVVEFEKHIYKELNYLIEVGNMLRFETLLEGTEGVCVPKVYEDFCTEKIMLMEFVDGIKISKIINDTTFDVKNIAQKTVQTYLEQILVYGFFHADPHPGNVLILPNNVICFLDFGLVGIIIQSDRENFLELLMGINNGNAKRIVDVVERISRKQIDDKKGLQHELSIFIEEYSILSLKQIDSQQFFEHFNKLMVEYGVQIPSSFLLLLKTLIMVEALVKNLNPDVNVLEEVKPFANKLLFTKLSPDYFLKVILPMLMDTQKLLFNLPSDIQDIINKFKKGEVVVDINHNNVEHIAEGIEKSVNKIVFGFIVASMILASSLIVLSDIPPKIYNIPVVGLIGYSISFVFAFWLLIKIMRKGM